MVVNSDIWYGYSTCNEKTLRNLCAEPNIVLTIELRSFPNLVGSVSGITPWLKNTKSAHNSSGHSLAPSSYLTLHKQDSRSLIVTRESIQISLARFLIMQRIEAHQGIQLTNNSFVRLLISSVVVSWGTVRWLRLPLFLGDIMV